MILDTVVETIQLSKVCSFQNGFAFKSNEYSESGYFLIRIGNVQDGFIDLNNPKYVDLSDQKLNRFALSDGDILISLTGYIGRVGIIKTEHLPAALNQRVAKIINEKPERLSDKYLIYFLKSATFLDALIDAGRGAAQQNVSTKDIGNIQIPIPPLPEQERIVAKLDAAFAAIDKAKANVERNLHNAKELFQSKLNEVFIGEKEGWVERPLSECIRLKSGDGLTAKNMIEGPYPVYGGNGVAGYHASCNLNGSHVIIGRVGALCGNARYIDEPIWLTDNAFVVSEYLAEFDPEFLTLLLNFRDLRSYARQAAQPVVSNSSLKDVPMIYPKEIEDQKRITQQMSSLREALDKLSSQFSNKLTELEGLKRSVLERAFRGEI